MSPVADLPPVLHIQTPAVDLTGHAPLGQLATGTNGWRDYTIKPGDTLYDLAQEHGSTISALAQRNDIRGFIYPGQVIEVPRSAGSAKASATSSNSSGSSSGAGSSGSTSVSTGSTTVTVRPGDTLSHIGARQQVSVASLIRANDLPSTMIYPGQQLTIPGKGATDSGSTGSGHSSPTSSSGTSGSSSSSGRTVTVRAGDTLTGIAAAQGVSLSALTNANPGVNARGLQVGQKISLPGAASRSTAERNASSSGKDVPNTFLHYTYSDTVAGSAAVNREYLAEVPVPSRDEVKTMVRETARRHGVDPDLMLAVSSIESGWNHRAVSPANAIGVMQVIPTSGDWASSMVGRELNLLDPQDNITAGTVIMRSLLRSADNEDQAIAGYYQGLHGVQTNGMYDDTKHYVAMVQGLRGRG